MKSEVIKNLSTLVGVTAACKQRRTCARYLSFMYDKPVHPRSFNASAAIRNCKDKIEVFNEH